MINCNPATVLYLPRLSLRHVRANGHTETRAHTAAGDGTKRDSRHFSTETTSSRAEISPSFLSCFRSEKKENKKGGTKKEITSTIKGKHPQCREEMWTFLCVRTLSVITSTFPDLGSFTASLLICDRAWDFLLRPHEVNKPVPEGSPWPRLYRHRGYKNMAIACF